MISLVIKQRIILAHIDGMSNRAIANVLHLSKDTVNKYVNEYNEKREELLRMHPDMDTSEIIQAFIEKPTYDSSNRIPSKATPELLEAVEKCLQLNRDKRLMGMQKQTIEKTRYPKMLLGILQSLVAQCTGTQMLVCLTIEGKQGRHLLGCHKVLIASPVLCRYLPAAIQLPGQILYAHPCHLRSQSVGYGLEEWGGDRLPVRLVEHYLGVC